MKDKIIYVADLDQDVDDIIAVEYMIKNNALNGIVCDPPPIRPEGLDRKNSLVKKGIIIYDDIPKDTERVFVGGALTKVEKYIKNNKLEYLIMNGGFVGSNIVKQPLKKFENKEMVRTFNFNCNVYATDQVLKSKNIENIVLVGKNVCHDIKNTLLEAWKDELDGYKIKNTKRQHDMLACREGLIILGLLDEESFLNFKYVYPFNNGLNDNMTEWGSKLTKESQYRSVLAATSWRKIDS